MNKMKITGYIAWGNGEPCPVCGKPFEKADMEHLEKEHPKEMRKLLVPDDK